MNEYAILEKGQVKVCDVQTWIEMFKGIEQRRVALTHTGNGDVSTVFLGLNHGFGEKPLWFETLVFGGTWDGEMDRYETLAEAQAGHDRMVVRVKQGE